MHGSKIVFKESLVVFDIGGTWFRSGIVTSNGVLKYYSKISAINYISNPDLRCQELQHALVDYILKTIKLLSSRHAEKVSKVAISMGAALNSHTGFIFDSGPLWGPKCQPCNLKEMLEQKNADIEWYIVNDITSVLMWHVKSASLYDNKTCLITISTGIGCRIYDAKTNIVPVDSEYGLQGEIGHIPIRFYINDKLIELNCDCGARNHLNAFCSGRGVERLLPIFPKFYSEKFKKSSIGKCDPDELNIHHLIKTIKVQDDFGLIILNDMVKPLAEMIVHLLVFDPMIGNIVLTGGLIHSLNPYYLDALLANVERIGMYQISEFDKDYFKKKIVIGNADDKAGLLGAAYCWDINKG